MARIDQPKHERLAADLRRRISSGEWPDGHRLPSESALCAEFDASRGTVRQALAALRSEGLVAGGQGRPPVVGHAVRTQSFDTFMSFTEWVARSGRTPGQRTVELARRPASDLIAGQLGIEPGEPVVQVLRVRSIDGEVALLERTSFVLDVGAHLFSFDTDSGSTYAHLKGCGVDLARARRTIDAVAADATDAELLGVPEGAPLLRDLRHAFDSSGRVLEFSDDRYIPTVTNFSIETTSERRDPLVRVPASSADVRDQP